MTSFARIARKRTDGSPASRPIRLDSRTVGSNAKKKVAKRAISGGEPGSKYRLDYKKGDGVAEFVMRMRAATSMEMVEIERNGVNGQLLKDLASTMNLPANRLFEIIGIPRATAEKKASANLAVTGSAGQAALGMVRLLGRAKAIVDNSTASSAKAFDVPRWLGRWIEIEQPALGGKKPSELLDTPTGIDAVFKLLGAVESGAFL